ncbi:MAG: entericidin A [Legionella sp.]|nr:MAG: entericidin A [Legionella sp.]PJD98414.1 MAG: entericidin A [Legionella sp.]
MNHGKKIMTVTLCIAALALLTSCSTVKGFGKDVSRTGQDIQRAAS